MPALRLSVKLGWQCVADPRDHHAVAPCGPTRLPEYSSNQVIEKFYILCREKKEIYFIYLGILILQENYKKIFNFIKTNGRSLVEIRPFLYLAAYATLPNFILLR